MDENFIKISDAVNLTGIPKTTLYDMVKDGRLKNYSNDEREKLFNKNELLKSIPTVITFFNQKGGVGKTTATVLLADYLQKNNFKVLLVDLDPQASLTDIYLKYDRERLTIYDNFENNTSLNKIVCTYNDNIDILPASLKMSRKAFIYESDLLQHKERFFNFFKKYEIIVIDCPPTMNSFSRFGVLLSNYILIPLIAHPLCYDGLDEALRTIKNLKDMNKDFVRYLGILNQYEGVETTLAKTMVDEYQKGLKEDLLEQKIRKFIGFAERTATDQNIFDLYKDKKPVDEMQLLFDNILKKVYDER